MQITAVQGDITEQRVDAIVNAANSSLLGGGGVDGAIHRRGGPEILAECRALRAGHLGGGLPTGQAVATTAGKLPARWVIHTVGPVYAKREDSSRQRAQRSGASGQEGEPAESRAALLRSCYTEALRVADELGAATVAFPLISAGVYGWPLQDAVTQALAALRAADTRVEEARLVLFGADAYAAAREQLGSG